MALKKYIVDNQSDYDKAIENRANQILEGYKKLNSKKYEELKKNEFKTDLRKRYEQLETDAQFLGVLHEIQKIEEDFDKGQIKFDAIKIYLKTSKIAPNKILEYLIEYYATIQAMLNKIPDYDNQSRTEQNETLPIPEQLITTYILNDKTISKIDFIRLINALWEMKAFKNKDGLYPTKQSVMKEFGNYVGIDLSNYETQLSKAVNTADIETNLKIFDSLKETMKKYFDNKVLAKKKNK